MIANSMAQPQMEWQHCLGGSGIERGQSVIETSDGNILVVGYTESSDGDVSSSIGGVDIWVVKLTQSGVLLWEKCIGNASLSDYGLSVSLTNNGGFIVGGYISSGVNSAAYVVKLDSVANVEWSSTYGSSTSATAFSVLQTPTGEYIAVGTETIGNDKDYCVVKFDTAGNQIWNKHYGGGDSDMARDAAIAPDGGYILTGQTESINGDVTGNHGMQDYWVVKLDTAGNIEWQKCFGGTHNDVAQSIINTPDGGYITSGKAFSTDGDVTGHHGLNLNTDFWVVKMDSAGTLQWQKCIGYSGGDDAEAIYRTPQGNYILTGPLSSNTGEVPGNRGIFDLFVVCIDSLGNELWELCAGSTEEDYAYDAIPTSDGDIVVTGYVSGGDIDVTGFHGEDDVWVFKLNNDFNKITGNAYFDLNSNAIHDVNEPPAQHVTISENNTGRFSFSGLDGSYSIAVFDTGNFSTQPLSTFNYYTSPLPQNSTFTGFYQVDSLNDFVYQPTGSYNDLQISVTPLGSFRTNQNALYLINYENTGTTTITPTILFFPDNNVSYSSANPAPANVYTDSVVWSMPSLGPFETGSILITVHVNSGLLVGTAINSSARIDPVAGDANTSNNYADWVVHTMASLDPNNILVNRDTVFTSELISPPWLEYIINFQNTGNDTAFNVRVLNNLPVALEHPSIEIINSSHPVNAGYGSYAGLMEFNFNNILLPNKSVDTAGSHGFVRYRVKPVSTLLAGDSIKNAAAIYFDYNEPGLTDTAVTVISPGTPLGITADHASNSGFIIYPNPASHYIVIRRNVAFQKDEIILVSDLYGRKIMEKQVTDENGRDEITFNISFLEPGIYFISCGNYTAGKFLKMK